MPAGDRTGPIGQGPVTGRRLGYCSGFDSPGFTKEAGYGLGRGFGYGRGIRYGRGMGFARGGGRGRGFWAFNSMNMPTNPWMQTMSREEEIKYLKSEADALKSSQKDIEKRLVELEKEE